MSTEAKEQIEQTSLKVVIRVRPLNKREIESNRQNIWHIDLQTNTISTNNTQNIRKYAFDRIYAPHHLTKDIYNESMSPVIDSFIHGYNGTIFAYGQTSSGKTYTMMGSGHNDGVIHRAIKAIFKSLAKANDRQFALRVSYLEIYNENIKDLLNPKKQNLKITQDNFHRPTVNGLTIESITNDKQIFDILKHGMGNRNIGATKMNDQSSRSHTIFQLHLESKQNVEINCDEFDGSVRSSILNIVDLAGSERAKKTDASGIRLKEGGHINKSLLTLGIVIKKLSELHKNNNRNSNEHIPYRDSKLTHILEPALGGNSKTVVICTVTPADIHMEETNSTLGFASRAKEVKNCASITEMRDDAAVIKQQKKTIAELERKLYHMNNGNDNNNNNETHNVTAMKEKYEMQINKLKSICMNPSHSLSDIITDSNNNKKISVLGKRRRHSIALECNGSPARKRLKTHIMRNLPRVRHASFSTPMNKVKCERDDYECKLRKQSHISKSLQQELYAKYKDFNAMQEEIDGLNEENKIYIQKIEFYESNVNIKDKDMIMENQKLTLKVNELNCELMKYKQKENNNQVDIEDTLNRELEVSKETIFQLEEQIRELRLDIERQHKFTESIRASSVEVSSDMSNNNDVLLRLGLHKLQSKLILIKNDKKAINQILQNEKNKFILFSEECNKKLIFYNEFVNKKFEELQNKLSECEDEKRLFESQYHQIREERDELRDEIIVLRRPENEIIDELQSELLTIQQQIDIDTNHFNNTQNELENKLVEIENLKQLNRELTKSMNEREEMVLNEYNIKINDLKIEINNLKQLNDKLENDINICVNNNISTNKIDNMNVSQLKDLYKNTRKNVRELQTKMSSIERKKGLHEKTAQKYTKRCNDLEQRLKLTLREHNNTKSELNNVNKENRSLKYKYGKLYKDIKKYQNDNINNKDLDRKLNLITKRLESLQKKYDIKNNELSVLKQEKINLIKQLNELKDNLNNNNNENKKLNKNIKCLQDNINNLNISKENILKDLNTEKDVVNMLQNELKKFHQINGKQKIKINELNNEINEYKNKFKNLNNEINKLNNNIICNEKNISEKNNKFTELNTELNDIKNKFLDKENNLLSQLESLKLNLQTVKDININQRNEIDETNKLLRDSQIELKENKKELIEYQNRWQYERKENDSNIEKLRVFELKTNNLLHENQMNKSSIESKIFEIDRLNKEFKLQQENLLSQISLNADLKIKYDNCENNINKLSGENQLLCNEKMRLIENIKDRENNENILQNKNIKLNNKLSEIKLEISKNKNNINENIENLNCKIKELTHEINDKNETIKNLNKKCYEINKKYEEIKKENKINILNLDEKENEILNLNEKIEDLYIEFEKEKKELNYKLNKKNIELNENINNLCELQKECDELINKNKIYKQMEIKYNELIIKYEKCEKELNNITIKYNNINNNLKNTMNKLQEITYKNEKLKDDLNKDNNNNNNNNESFIAKKYAKAKEIIHNNNQIIETAKTKIKKYKDRLEHYETAIGAWKNNAIDLKNQIHELKDKIKEQNIELCNLRPSKSKARKFEQLCKEYHRAKNNQYKVGLICRETQTYECKLPNYNKENVNTNNTIK